MMTPEEKQAAEKAAQGAIENKRQAVSMVAALSGQLVTAALGMIALQGAYVAFAADKKQCGFGFWLTMTAAFLIFVYSIVRAGKGTAVLYKAGAEGDWDYASANSHFRWQTGLCFIGIALFMVAVITARKDKPSESEAVQKQLQTVGQAFEKQAAINQQFLSQWQTNHSNLESRMQIYNQQLQSVVQTLEKQSQVNQQFLAALVTNQQSAELRAQLANQQLQSLVQVFEKQVQINQNFLSQLQTNHWNEQLRSRLDQIGREIEQLLREVQGLKKTKKHDDD